MNDCVITNIGTVPIEDYLEICSLQYGFDSYDELLEDGFVLDVESDSSIKKS